MTVHTMLSLIAGALLLLSQGFYIAAIVRGETKPSQASWIVWTLLTWMLTGGMWQAGTHNAQIVAACFGDTLILALTFRYGSSTWSRTDAWSLVVSMLGLLAWVFTRQPLVAISLSLVVTAIGCVPTYRKTWKHPDQEDWWAWTIVATSSALQTLTVVQWTYEDALQPVAWLLMQAPMILFIPYRKHALRHIPA